MNQSCEKGKVVSGASFFFGWIKWMDLFLLIRDIYWFSTVWHHLDTGKLIECNSMLRGFRVVLGLWPKQGQEVHVGSRRQEVYVERSREGAC